MSSHLCRKVSGGDFERKKKKEQTFSESWTILVLNMKFQKSWGPRVTWLFPWPMHLLNLWPACMLSYSVMSDSAILWTVFRQDPLSMEFYRQEYWSGLPLLSPGDLPDLGIEPESPALAGGFFTTEPPGKPKNNGVGCYFLLQAIFPTQG